MENDPLKTPTPGVVSAKPWGGRERWALLGLLLLAFGFRLWNVQAMRANPRFDAPVMDGLYHLDWARAILAGEMFQEGAFFRAPLYPWFMAAVLKISGESLFALRIFQALLGTCTVALTLLIARQSFGRAAGWLAGAVSATYWVLVYFDGELLIPTLYVPLLLAGLFSALVLPQRNFSWRACLICGLFFGLAAIARPNVLLFMPPLAIWLLWQAGRGKRAWLATGMLTLGTLIPILPITVHNYVSSGEGVLIASQAGVNFWIGNNPASDGMSAIVPGTRAGWWEGFEDSRRLARQEAGEDLSDKGISQHYTTKVWSWMADNPTAALRHQMWKLRLFFLDWEVSNNQEIRFVSHRYNVLSRFGLSFAWLAGFGLLGAALALGAGRWRLFPLWGFLGTYTLSVVAFFVCSRFRVPVLPVLIVLGSGASVRLVVWAQAKRWVPLAAAFVLLGLVVGFSSNLPRGLVTDESGGLLALGNDAMQRGELDRAEALYAEGLNASVRNSQLRLAWASLLQSRQQDSAARLWLTETLQMFPSVPEVRVALCSLENSFGNYSRAAALAIDGLDAQGSLTGLRYELGRAYIGLNEFELGLTEFTKVMELDPLDFVAPYAKGLVHMEQGQRSAAMQAFRAAQANADRARPDELQRLQEILSVPSD
ncbi:MAG: 4-amino-4-deoxy-L-arabinose transferase-like glycosyltransferase/Tfp pilus assembly protein PilF [Glaciecola sp.]|jgi:4-amino-4-deoxy-L-arabinose transferase-like glycosyltransferase/Tfp pilus assembly protein PilF